MVLLWSIRKPAKPETLPHLNWLLRPADCPSRKWGLQILPLNLPENMPWRSLKPLRHWFRLPLPARMKNGMHSFQEILFFVPSATAISPLRRIFFSRIGGLADQLFYKYLPFGAGVNK